MSDDTPLVGTQSEAWIESGLNEQLEPFLSVRAEGTADGRDVVLVGQLKPAEVRELALLWVEEAAAAEQDSIVAQQLVHDGVPLNGAMVMVAMVRARRAKGQPGADEERVSDGD